MAGEPDVSPYDDITSDELFDSFMDVVSGVEQSFNGDNEQNADIAANENPYEDIGTITDAVSHYIYNSGTVKEHVEKELSQHIPLNDSMHLPLLVKLTAEPIYESCGTYLSDHVNKPLISDLDTPLHVNNADNTYTDTNNITSSGPKILSRTRESSRRNDRNLGDDRKVENLNSTDVSSVPIDSPLYASVSLETRTKPIITDEYAVVNKERKVQNTTSGNSTDNNRAHEGACNNDIVKRSESTDDNETKTISVIAETESKQNVADLYAIVNKGGSDLEEVHKKVHNLRQRSQSSSLYNTRPPSLSPTCNDSNNNSNNSDGLKKYSSDVNLTISNTNHENSDATTSSKNGNNSNGNNSNNNIDISSCDSHNANINNNEKTGVTSSVIVSKKHDQTSPLKRSSQCVNSDYNINQSKQDLTVSNYESISDLKRCDTTTSVSSNKYSNIDDIRNYDTDPHSPEVVFKAEQIAFGFSKTPLPNGNSITPPPNKPKDKRNFFGFGKWKSSDESSKSQSISAEDLGKDSKTLSPPSTRPDNGNPVLCSGYLFKQGGTGFTPKNWRLRWFELKRDNFLYYYKSEQDNIPIGAVILLKYQILRNVEVNKRFAFKLSKPGARTYHFAANSEDEMKKWMTHLSEAIKYSGYSQSDLVSIPECSLKNVSIPATSITDPDHQGYLSKQGGTVKTWKRRYCVLKYGCLFYYEDMTDKVAIGVFKLQKYNINTSNNTRHGFEAAPPMRKMRTYYFYTNTETDTRRWIDAMKRSISSLQH